MRFCLVKLGTPSKVVVRLVDLLDDRSKGIIFHFVRGDDEDIAFVGKTIHPVVRNPG